MIDYNNDLDTSSSPRSDKPDQQREEIRAAVLGRLEPVLFTLFPAGKVRRGKFHIGDILGSPGDSLESVIDGEKPAFGRTARQVTVATSSI